MNYYFYLLTAPSFWTINAVFGEKLPWRGSLDFEDLTKYDGYDVEKHFVTTQDGYILGVFRIPPRTHCTENKGPLMFMHGLYLSSDDCIIPGPGKAHCYIYSDSCYDVWAPNVRGNYYSRNHTIFNPDKESKFWDFSFDEMAMHDLPAAIDYVLDTTNNSQLTYVGHSQGVSILLVLCSKIPIYNSKIKVGFGLSATAWLDHARLIVIQVQKLLALLMTQTRGMLAKEVLTRGGIVNNAARLMCGVPNVSYPFCSYLLFAVLGYNNFQITSDVLPVIMNRIPSGTSLKNFNRWGQIKNNGFTEYDYGQARNLLVYGKRIPPPYDLHKVTMKWVMIGSLNDYVGDVTDVKLLVSKLSNVSLCVLADKTFGHFDFIYGKSIPNYITPIVLETLNTGNYKCL